MSEFALSIVLLTGAGLLIRSFLAVQAVGFEPEHGQAGMDRSRGFRTEHNTAVLAGLARSNFYYQGLGEMPENLDLMRLIDEQYTRTPFYGIRRLTAWLQNNDYDVNHKRVARLMRQMGLEASGRFFQGAGGA